MKKYIIVTSMFLITGFISPSIQVASEHSEEASGCIDSKVLQKKFKNFQRCISDIKKRDDEARSFAKKEYRKVSDAFVQAAQQLAEVDSAQEKQYDSPKEVVREPEILGMCENSHNCQACRALLGYYGCRGIAKLNHMGVDLIEMYLYVVIDDILDDYGDEVYDLLPYEGALYCQLDQAVDVFDELNLTRTEQGLSDQARLWRVFDLLRPVCKGVHDFLDAVIAHRELLQKDLTVVEERCKSFIKDLERLLQKSTGMYLLNDQLDQVDFSLGSKDGLHVNMIKKSLDEVLSGDYETLVCGRSALCSYFEELASRLQFSAGLALYVMQTTS